MLPCNLRFEICTLCGANSVPEFVEKEIRRTLSSEQIPSLFTWSGVKLWIYHSGSGEGDEFSVSHAEFLPSLDCPAHDLGNSLCLFQCEQRMNREHVTLNWRRQVWLPIHLWSKKNKNKREMQCCVLNDNWRLLKWALYTSSESRSNWGQTMNHPLFTETRIRNEVVENPLPHVL